WAIVPDTYANGWRPAQCGAIGMDANRSVPVFSVPTVFHCIFDKIAKSMRQRLPVGFDYGQVRSDFFFDADSCFLQRLAGSRKTVFEQRLNFKRFAGPENPSTFHIPVAQNLFDECGQFFALV